MGVNPVLTLRSRGDGMDLLQGKKIEHLRGNPLTVLARLLRERRVFSGSPLVPFSGGAVGYFGYELGGVTLEREMDREDDLGLPDMHVAFYNTILAYDHKGKRWIGAAVDFTGGRGATIRKRLGVQIDKLVELAKKPHRGPAPTAPVEDEDEGEMVPFEQTGARETIEGLEVVSSMSREEYLGAVRTIQERIAAGDIYQANLTQRWTVDYPGDPGDLYRRLREASPAPFGIYLNAGECVIAGSSPESFLAIRGREIETRPIKGTRPRGATPDEDARLMRELELSEKDKAELTMIADLERNDLGQVCSAGTVEVKHLHKLESFSNVHHLVSVVRGELEPGTGIDDILTATFPGGSITGAPKRKAVEILDGVEKRVRGPYTGAMGFLGLDGNAELNIAIRTLVLTQGQCHIGVGSGIVADSSPEREWDECVTKARDMVKALREASAPKAEPEAEAEPEAKAPAESAAVPAPAATVPTEGPENAPTDDMPAVTPEPAPPAPPEPAPPAPAPAPEEAPDTEEFRLPETERREDPSS